MAVVSKVSRRSKPRAQRDQGIGLTESTGFYSVYFMSGSVPGVWDRGVTKEVPLFFKCQQSS